MCPDDMLEQVVFLHELIEKNSSSIRQNDEPSSHIGINIKELENRRQRLISDIADWAVRECLVVSNQDIPTHDPTTFIDYMGDLFESRRLIS